MFDKFSYTLSLMGASWEVLKRDKELLLFPLMSAIACGIVSASFFIGMWGGHFLSPPGAEAQAQSKVLYYGLLFLFYFANYFVIIFFNAGIVACAVKRMRGGDPTVADGLGAAFGRLHAIFGWALVSATVSTILRMIEDRSTAVAGIIAAILGVAWSVATFLVVPILVVERKGPVAAARQSARMLKHTWGEQIIGGFGFGLVFIVLAIPGVVLVIMGAVGSGPAVAFAVLGVVYLLLLALVQSALHVIFQSAVYLYAAGESTPGAFGDNLLSGAMQSR
ncbi:MAG: DUF6159 family protein [Planctomycetota bacterium]